MKIKHIHPLLKIRKKTGGRNHQGKITVKHIGGGNKRFLRKVDYKRNLIGKTATILKVEKDPNISSKIALICYNGGILSYILLPENLTTDNYLYANKSLSSNIGSHLPIKNIIIGSLLHNIELQPGRGGKLVRSAGTYAILLSKNKTGYALIKLPSGEIKKVTQECAATIGILSNSTHNLRSFKSAGKKRLIGRRPHTRGVAMNPVDHPHGGGEGKSGPGRPSVSFSGIPTKGKRTRKNKKTNYTILKRRH